LLGFVQFSGANIQNIIKSKVNAGGDRGNLRITISHFTSKSLPVFWQGGVFSLSNTTKGAAFYQGFFIDLFLGC
jgi:hypothetical protein